MSIFGMVCIFLIFLQNCLPNPVPHLLRYFFVSQDCNKPFFFCLKNCFICIWNIFCLHYCYRCIAGSSIWYLGLETRICNTLCTVYISGDTFISLFNRIGIILLQLLDSIFCKTVWSPFFPYPIVIETCFFAILLYSVAKVNERVFSFRREINQRNMMI